MNYLKKYLTANVCSIYGYILTILALRDVIINPEDLYIFEIIINRTDGFSLFLLCGYVLLITLCIILVFLIELILHFIFKKIFNKDLSVAINEKHFDFIFRLGIGLCFLPSILSMIFYVNMPIQSFVELFTDGKYCNYFESNIILFTYFFVFMNIYIQFIFSKKQK